MSFRVAHLTSVHPRHDTRIFFKMCAGIASRQGRCVLVVADGLGDTLERGVQILDVGVSAGGRVARLRRTGRRILELAHSLDVEIFHLHDPELIPVGARLRQAGKKVIFDSHEDVPEDILVKPYLPTLLRPLISSSYAFYEKVQCRRFEAVVAATPYIRDRFLRINPRTVDVNNFPILDEISPASDPGDNVCYVGGISEVRGIRQIVQACESLSPEGQVLHLAGSFSDPRLEAEMREMPGWSRINAHGYLDRAGVSRVLGDSLAGLVTLHPIATHLDALPVKMFEYMAAGIAVIASDFPLWRNIVESSGCGVCVDPCSPDEIAEAINYMLKNPGEARRMGENGRRAVEQQYNWHNEELKLHVLYESL